MIRYEIRIDEAHLAEGMRRRRKVGLSQYGRVVLKAVAYVGLVALAFVGVIVHAWPITLFAAALAGLMLFAPRMDVWLYARRLRKSPFYGCVATIEVDDDGYCYQSDPMSTRGSWRLFTSANRLQDGFILFDTDGNCMWWPDSALVEGTPEQMRSLLQAHVTRYAAT